MLTGLALVLVAVLAASISNVMQIMPAIKARPVAPLLGWAMLYGATANAVFGWAFVGPPVVEPRLGYWLGIVYLGLIASALAFWLYYDIIRKIGPAKAAYSSVLIPIIAMAISTVAEGYRWSALALAGGALALAGLVIALRSSRVAAAAARRLGPQAAGLGASLLVMAAKRGETVRIAGRLLAREHAGEFHEDRSSCLSPCFRPPRRRSPRISARRPPIARSSSIPAFPATPG